MRSLLVFTVVPLLGLCACRAAPASTARPRPHTDEGVVPAATDSPTVRDTGRPVTPVESDDPPPPEPPTTWGPGFVELLGEHLAIEPMFVPPGSQDEGRAPQLTFAWFGDLDNDGVAEVAVGLDPNGLLPEEVADVRVYRWEATGLRPAPGLAAQVAGLSNRPLAAVDIDGDGLTDLVGRSVFDAVRWGRVGGGFTDPVRLVDDGPSQIGGLGLGFVDLDQDGLLDLFFGSNGCTLGGVVALQQGPRRFEVRTDVLDVGQDIGAVAEARLEDGSRVFYALSSNGCSERGQYSQFFRVASVGPDNIPRLASYDPTPDDAWWKLLPGYVGLPVDVIAPMGAGFEDLDGDGRLDAVVSIGLGPQALLRGVGDGRFTPWPPDTYQRTAPSGGAMTDAPWSVAFPDVDLDGRPEILWTIGDDDTVFRAANGFLMQNALSWNGGPGRFVDVEHLVGLTAEGSWRALGLADPDGDGDADLVFGGQGFAPLVYRNEVDVEGRRGVSLRLVGTTSNPLAIGARVEAHVAGLPVRTATVGGLANPLGVSAPVVFAGAGTRPVVDLIRITWPSGLVHEVRDLPTGAAHTIVEPVTVEILDRDRRELAGGVAGIDVRITPRRVDGSPDVSATVALTLGGAPARLDPPSHDGAGVHTARVWSAEEPGVTWLEVAVNGLPLQVRPKLFWQPRR